MLLGFAQVCLVLIGFAMVFWGLLGFVWFWLHLLGLALSCLVFVGWDLCLSNLVKFGITAIFVCIFNCNMHV